MAGEQFQVGAAVGYGWRKTWRNFWWLLLVSIIVSVIVGIASSISGFADPSSLDQGLAPESANETLLFVGAIVSFLVATFMQLGVIRVAIGVTNGDRARVGRLFSFDGFGRFLLGAIIIGILVTIGFGIPILIGALLSGATGGWFFLVLFGLVGLVLAIILTLGLSLFGFVIVDQNVPGLGSLRASWALVRPRFWGLFGLHILVSLIVIGVFIAAVILGIITLFVGLLVTIPIATVLAFGIPILSVAYAYRTLSGQGVA